MAMAFISCLQVDEIEEHSNNVDSFLLCLLHGCKAYGQCLDFVFRPQGSILSKRYNKKSVCDEIVVASNEKSLEYISESASMHTV